MRSHLRNRHLFAFALLVALAMPALASKPAPLAVSPASTSVAAGGQVRFTASGGSGGYEFSLSQNESGGSIDAASGVYLAGTAAGTDTVTVTDDAGKAVRAQVQVKVAAGADAPAGSDLGGHR